MVLLYVAWFGQICNEGHYDSNVHPRPNGDGESGKEQGSSGGDASQWEVSFSYGFASLEEKERGMIRDHKKYCIFF